MSPLFRKKECDEQKEDLGGDLTAEVKHYITIHIESNKLGGQPSSKLGSL